jgi:hypothetical protein
MVYKIKFADLMKNLRALSVMLLIFFSAQLNAQTANKQSATDPVTAESFAKSSSSYMKSTFHLSDYQTKTVEAILTKYPGNFNANIADFSNSHSWDAQREIIEVLTPEQGEQYKVAMATYQAKQQQPVQPNSKQAPKSTKSTTTGDKK